MELTEYELWLSEVEVQSVYLQRLSAESHRPAVEPTLCTVHTNLQRVRYFESAEGQVPTIAMVAAQITITETENRDEVLGAVEITAGAVYDFPADTRDDYLERFALEAVNHVWPLFRQYMRTLSSDFGWPAISLPMHHRLARDVDVSTLSAGRVQIEEE